MADIYFSTAIICISVFLYFCFVVNVTRLFSGLAVAVALVRVRAQAQAQAQVLHSIRQQNRVRVLGGIRHRLLLRNDLPARLAPALQARLPV